MEPIKVLELLRDILEKAETWDNISIGYDKNEDANIMWFSSNSKNNYLAINNKLLFPFSCIENITYRYQREDSDRIIDFYYEDDLCVLMFHLKGNCMFVVECDKDCMLHLYFNSSPKDNTKWIEENTTDFKYAVSKYTLAIEKQKVFEDLIVSLFDSLDNQHLDTDHCDNQHRIIFDYLLSNKNDDETLFLYAYEAANYSKDYPYFVDIISEIKNRGLNDELLVYARKRCRELNWCDNDRSLFNMTLQFITEKIIKLFDSTSIDALKFI